MYVMELNPSDGNKFQSVKESSAFQRIQGHCRSHRSEPLVPMLILINDVYALFRSVDVLPQG
jgi:hypothetical protein